MAHLVTAPTSDMMRSQPDELNKTADASQSPRDGDSMVMEALEEIDPVIHKRTMLKLDTVVLGCFGVMYLMANLDRNNLVSLLHRKLMILFSFSRLVNCAPSKPPFSCPTDRNPRATRTSWASPKT